MSNIINHNFSDFNVKLNKDDYYDYFINSDSLSSIDYDAFYDNCLISNINIENKNCVGDNCLYGLDNYTWKNSINYNNVLCNIGYTGVDNGLIKFSNDKISNSKFIELYTNSKYELGDRKVLQLHKVSGATNKYSYPITIVDDKIKLNGGFYQGFFKTKCNEYQVLPSNFENGEVYTLEFQLNKQDFISESHNTLNDKYPNNKGLFFYIGTRSENKWSLLYSNEDYFCDYQPFLDYVYFNDYEDENNAFDDYILDDTDMIINDAKTKNGIYLSDNDTKFFDTNNKFLFFNRTKDGFTIKNWEDNNLLRFFYKENDNDNLYLLMNRTNDGYTIKNIDEYRQKKKKKYNVYDDIINNAFALRISDDGEIGYRYLIKDVVNHYKVVEGYSNKNIIENNKWCTIHVKFYFKENTMNLYFYVNGKLIYVTDELPKLNLRDLNDLYEKQEGVPYNISLGGGTQGLSEVIMPNYMLDVNKIFPIEQYFAGSFIGYFKSFKIYNCDVEPNILIKNNINNL